MNYPLRIATGIYQKYETPRMSNFLIAWCEEWLTVLVFVLGNTWVGGMLRQSQVLAGR